MTTVTTWCLLCDNYIEKGRCRAFPEGIPDALYPFGKKHTEPFPGDNGVRFTPLKEGSKP